MKTAEQNFVLFLDHVNAHVDRVLRDKGMSNKEIQDAIVSTPMPEFFSDQQNKELRGENEELRKGLMFQGLVPNSKDAEIQRLTAENKELRDKVESMQNAVFVVTNPNAEIKRLTKEVEKAMEAPNIDEEAHNYAACKIWIDKRDVEIQTPPVHEFHEYIANKSFKAGAELMMPQLTRLTKEVEEFRKSDREHIYYADKLEREITRLRELLVKCVPLIQFSRRNPGTDFPDDEFYQRHDQLLLEINALNHKP